jgi:hypothetical protein
MSLPPDANIIRIRFVSYDIDKALDKALDKSKEV